jgi:quinol monooxygenase YgiN
MIRLNVTVTVEPPKREELLEKLLLLAEGSRAEKGCLGYEIYENSLRREQLFIVETWADDEALRAHGKTAHYTTLLPLIEAKAQLNLERFDY